MPKERKESAERTPTVEVVLENTQATQIEYCGEHYSDLMTALLDRQLTADMATSSEQLRNKLEKGIPDASLEAASAITSAAISLFGPHAILAAKGCPVCAFNNIIIHVADHMAVKYRKSN